jgi:regulator of nucleoside diphosphate kinase
MLARLEAQPRPAVYVTEADYERLANLAETHDTSGGALLAAELDRAIVIGDGDAPQTFARLLSVVEFRDLDSGRVRRLQLVPPDQADIDAGRVSVVTPVGAALIGLKPGDAIGLTAEDGRPRVLTILGVEAPHDVG